MEVAPSLNDGCGPIKTWRPSDPIPQDAAADPETLIVAHHDAFERQLEEYILQPRYQWPIFSLERRRCTQASALSHALPAALDDIAAALKLEIRKTAAGKKAMKLLAQPRKPRKGEDPMLLYWCNDPQLLETLYAYNRMDVEITAAIVRRLGFISPAEQRVWELDAAINARGVRCDIELLDAAIAIAEQAAAELKEKIDALSDGAITSIAQTKRIQEWLSQHGCDVPNVQEETLLEALKRTDLSADARRLIELRLDGAHAAVNKLATTRCWVGVDQRIRHAYRYHGAMPGRFTSIGVQLQNLKKPTVEDVGAAIEAVRSGSLAYMQERYERSLSVIGDITRALIVPAPGHRLFIADLSGIESRGLAWLTNEQSKLEAWRNFDCTGNPEDEPYYRFGAEELKLEGAKARGTGKTCDLAFGYEGSLGAWRRLAPADDNTPDEEVYRRCRAWKRRHPNIKKFWATSVRQAVNALEHPAEPFTVARVAFAHEGEFLHMELSSGRRIRYPFARIYSNDYGKTFTFRDASGGRWEWYHVLKKGRGAFGGLIAENATQALCRDVFVDAMLRLEGAGYHVVAHLHDEFICEVPDGFGDLDEFRAIITTPPTWAPDFPIAAKARIADRFIEIKEPKGRECCQRRQ
jgi:DNA polymerase